MKAIPVNLGIFFLSTALLDIISISTDSDVILKQNDTIYRNFCWTVITRYQWGWFWISFQNDTRWMLQMCAPESLPARNVQPSYAGRLSYTHCINQAYSGYLSYSRAILELEVAWEIISLSNPTRMQLSATSSPQKERARWKKSRYSMYSKRFSNSLSHKDHDYIYLDYKKLRHILQVI